MICQGLGTNDDALIRVIVSRSEVDLVEIKHEFQYAYGQSLEAFVAVIPVSLQLKIAFVQVVENRFLVRNKGRSNKVSCLLEFA